MDEPQAVKLSGEADPTPSSRRHLLLAAARGVSFDQQLIVALTFAALFVAFSLVLPGFFTFHNLLTLMRTVAVLGILGLGMAVVVVGRGIDLSIIASLTVPTALILSLADKGFGIVTSLACGFALSAAIGVLNGVLVAYAEIPSLFATLAVGIGIAGLGQSGMFEYEIIPWSSQLDRIAWIGRGSLLGVPYSVLAFAAASLCLNVFMGKTRVGRFIYAIGDSPGAARITGISVRPVIVLSFVIAAMIGTFAGLVLAASSNNMDTRIFNLTWIYDVILIVVIGGIGLSGGRGGVRNVLVGTLLIGTLVNGMTIMNVSFELQNLVKGIVLLLALLFDSIINPRNEETAQQGDI